VAQQEAERSKFVVLKAEQERQAAIIRAEGESEGARGAAKRASALAAEARALGFEAELEAERQAAASKRSA
jgi:hypothetical protein